MAALSSTSGSISLALITRPRAFESFCGDRLGIPFKVNPGDQSQFSRKYRSRVRLTRSIAATAQQLHRKSCRFWCPEPDSNRHGPFRVVGILSHTTTRCNNIHEHLSALIPGVWVLVCALSFTCLSKGQRFAESASMARASPHRESV